LKAINSHSTLFHHLLKPYQRLLRSYYTTKRLLPTLMYVTYIQPHGN